MKAKNLNNSSKKTRKIIKKVFAQMLAEKKELNLITVSELCKRSEISRGTFYSHYNDIYGVAEDYENELIDVFFDSSTLLNPTNVEQFIDIIFSYIKQNNENYKQLCNSNDFIFTAKKITSIAINKFLELCNQNNTMKNRNYLDLEINIFIEGLFCEYVKYCRGYSATTLDELESYTKEWVKSFKERRL